MILQMKAAKNIIKNGYIFQNIILIIGGYGSGKISKYWCLIEKHENAGIRCLSNSNEIIECWNSTNDVYDDINDYNPTRKRKILIVFDDMIWWYDDDMIIMIWYNKEFQIVVKELFLRCRKLNISLVFITQYYLSVPKNDRLNSTHYLIMKINKKRRELQNVVINHSADIDYKDFVKIYRKCTKELYSFLTIDTIL